MFGFRLNFTSISKQSMYKENILFKREKKIICFFAAQTLLSNFVKKFL